MAAQIAGNAQKMGIVPVYFDAESAIDPMFLESAGIDTESLMYIQAVSVEKVLETIETLIDQYADNQFLFIWDSIAATSSEKELESDFNPNQQCPSSQESLAKHFQSLPYL